MTPYDEALQFIKQHPGTGGAGSMAKLILSLYNNICGFSFAECVGNLDGHLTAVALRMVTDYAARGETDDLRAAGRIIANDLYPGLWEMSLAMNNARQELREKWKADERKAERDELLAKEAVMFTDPAKLIPPAKAKELLGQDDPIYGYIYSDFSGDWRSDRFALETVHEAIDLAGGGELSSNCPESGGMLAIRIKERVHYLSTDYDAREAYLEEIGKRRPAIPLTVSQPVRK